MGVWGWVGSHDVAGKAYVFTKASQMASIGAIFTSTYHTKQVNPWSNSSASCVVNFSQLSTCQGDMQPFEGNLSTCECLTSLRNKPQQKQPRQLSASILLLIVSQCIKLLFNGEKCVLLLYAWQPAFLKSSHKCWLLPSLMPLILAVYPCDNKKLANMNETALLMCIHFSQGYITPLKCM